MEKQRLTSASRSTLPMVSEIPDSDTMKRAIALMKEAAKLKIQVSEAEDRLNSIRTELAAICEAYGTEHGFRYGHVGFEYHGYITRKSFSKEKAVTLIPADVIDQCYTESEPFLLTKVVVFDLD